MLSPSIAASCAVTVWMALLCSGAQSTSYVLGPNDEVTIRVLDLPDIGPQPIRIDLLGNLSVPLIGSVPAGGLTVEQLQTQLTGRLSKYLREPQVTVGIAEFRSQPVSVLGAVNKPGIHQLQGRKTLFEVLSLAEGLRNDAGNTIKITRQKDWGDIPLANATTDTSGTFSIAEVNVTSVMEAKKPEENIRIMPNDVISVPRAELVYVVGSVHRSGGFVLGERETISVLQALSLAEGLDHTASPQNAKIIRSADGAAKRAEIAVDVRKILNGKGIDVPLRAKDILFIPSSVPKAAGLRILESAVQMGTGVVIYRR